MDINFQLLDCDYIMLENSPLVRIFGKTDKGKTVCAFYKNFFPYFYILPKKGLEDKLIEFLKSNFGDLILKIEEAEKFLPIGFQKEKTKFLKVFLKDPAKVPSLRESLKEQKFVQELFEADILFKYRFMADFSISGMKWVKVVGKSISTQTVKTDETIEIEAIEEMEREDNVDFKYMALDIEVIPSKEGIPDARKDPIAMISAAFYPAYGGQNTLVLISKQVKKFDKDVLAFKDEKEMLQEFVQIIEKFDPDFFVGYNINNFDFPYLLERLKVNKISCAIGRCSSKAAIARKVSTRYRNSVVGRVIVDVYDLVRESIKKGALRLKRLGLGDVSKGLLNEEKVDIAHSEIGRYWNGSEAEIKKLVDYARKDAELALKILLEKKLLDKFLGLAKVSGLLLQDVLDSGESSRVENLLLREFNKQDYILSCKPSKEIIKREEERKVKELKGALVLEPKVGLHTNCVVYMDFKAMYPSLFIAYNICTSTLLLSKEKELETIKTPYGTEFVSPKVKKGIIPRILAYLIKERDKVKEQIKQAKTELERRNLDAKQYAMKVMANAFYGYMGYIKARLYVLDIANAITSCGREFIKKTKAIVEKDSSFEVIYGDTDSIAVKTQTKDLEQALKIGYLLEERINKELKVVQMKIEGIFRSVLVLTKKRYAGLICEKVNGKWKEELVMKGIETVRRDWCDLTEETLYNVLEIILKEQNTKKAFDYVKDVLFKLEKNQIPLEKLAITKGISKPLREYKGVQPHIELVKKLRKRSPATAPGVGDRVSFVIVKGLELLSQRAEDLEYVKQKGLKIDSKYYIESQVLPPLERVFEVIGINKSELIGIGRQLVLSEAIKNNLKKTEEKVLTSVESFVCDKCDQAFRRIPLTGRCNCGGEVVFYSNGVKSRFLAL